LLFSFAGTAQRDTLKQAGVKPQHLYPQNSFYHALKKQGVTSSILQHREYTPSSYGDVIFSGARALGYKTLPEVLVNLVDTLNQSALGDGKTSITSPAYFVLYNDRIDAISHEYGPGSLQTSAEIRMLLMTFENILLKAWKDNRKRILFMLTADHGQSEVDPQTTVYINREARFAGIENYLRRNRKDEMIVPGGSARDFFLYIQPGLVDEAESFLAARLEGKAEVRKVADLMASGWFGPRLSPLFCKRAGDLVILPYRHESVWWFEKNRYEQKYYGHHGGLTPQEMEIPLLTWEM
jgi:predicted AlkP superfamily pyrophosphatase or phosphodiesterase